MVYWDYFQTSLEKWECDSYKVVGDSTTDTVKIYARNQQFCMVWDLHNILYGELTNEMWTSVDRLQYLFSIANSTLIAVWLNFEIEFKTED